MLSVAFNWEDYGGKYHCWTQMNKQGLIMFQLIPIIVLVRVHYSRMRIQYY